MLIYHSWACISHYGSYSFLLFRTVAMDIATDTGRLGLSKRAFI